MKFSTFSPEKHREGPTHVQFQGASHQIASVLHPDALTLQLCQGLPGVGGVEWLTGGGQWVLLMLQ